jgi:hypothetical protein
MSPEVEDLHLPSILPSSEFVAVINDGGPDHGLFVYVNPLLAANGNVRTYHILPWDHLGEMGNSSRIATPRDLRLLNDSERDLFRKQLGSRNHLPGFPIPSWFDWQVHEITYKEDDPFPPLSEFDLY